MSASAHEQNETNTNTKETCNERSVLRRQKPGTVFRQKWRHQWHCRHL